MCSGYRLKRIMRSQILKKRMKICMSNTLIYSQLPELKLKHHSDKQVTNGTNIITINLLTSLTYFGIKGLN
jgi:hypothetical protein